MDKQTSELRTALAQLPASLRSNVAGLWDNYCQAATEQTVSITLSAEQARELARVWACSEFIARSCIRYPQLLVDLLTSDDLMHAYETGEMRRHVQTALAGITDETQLAAQLRHCRRREMVRIAWRDLAGHAPLQETMLEVSLLAESCIDEALRQLELWQRLELGTPIGEPSGEKQSLIVLGMGKLGAYELNFSSDIDLIFAYPEAGETVNGPRAIANEQFFTTLGRRLIKALDANTAEGFAYRVDMRLRPNGDSGPLAMSFAAMESYYQLQGRDWERYAMIKARPVAGDIDSGQQLLDSLRPFVYRRYLDYGTFEALREMKAMINNEVQRKGMQANIKLGPGGIREIEFIGQLFQLIRGGRESVLRQREILSILTALVDTGHLPAYVGRELLQDYSLLRRIENRLQAWADDQTHSLPSDSNSSAWDRLTLSLNPPQQFEIDVESWRRQIRQLRARVQGHFEQVFEAPQANNNAATGAGTESAIDWQAVWLGHETALEPASGADFKDVNEVLRRLKMLRESHACRSLSAQGRNRLDRLIPMLLSAIAEAGPHTVGGDGLDRTLFRLLSLIESIMRRTAYLALLIEHPLALSQLVKLCGASPWISDHLARNPILLDELLDPRVLYAPPQREQLMQQLQAVFAVAAADDIEQQLETLRLFKQTQVLRVAASDLAGVIPLMVVSDHLAWIAEVIIDQVVKMAIRHNVPPAEQDKVTAGFGVIAYGKLGGQELGYGSDLDLVFLHDGNQKLITHYTRLGQRIVHIMTIKTAAGSLYEVDMRLRPSGASGLLVSSIEAFGDYQQSDAWTWEHQALLRARFVAGSANIAEQFQQIRQAILRRRRENDELRFDVRGMRDRMRQELGRGNEQRFDIKQDVGGIADIEFLVQYAVLRWGADDRDLVTYTDNIRQLQALAKGGFLSDIDCRLLIDAYQAYRAFTHRQALQQEPVMIAADEFGEYRRSVTQIWQHYMETD